jgi:hypothetical protein
LYIVESDYAKVPVRMSCGLIETFRPRGYTDKPDVREAWENLLDGVPGQRDILLVVRGVSRGASVKSYVQPDSFPLSLSAKMVTS